MLITDQERINNALKEMLYIEELMAKKYQTSSERITDPKLQQMFKGMEQATPRHHKMLSDQMSTLGIV